jgi:hypothetical protein
VGQSERMAQGSEALIRIGRANRMYEGRGDDETHHECTVHMHHSEPSRGSFSECFPMARPPRVELEHLNLCDDIIST